MLQTKPSTANKNEITRPTAKDLTQVSDGYGCFKKCKCVELEP